MAPLIELKRNVTLQPACAAGSRLSSSVSNRSMNRSLHSESCQASEPRRYSSGGHLAGNPLKEPMRLADQHGPMLGARHRGHGRQGRLGSVSARDRPLAARHSWRIFAGVGMPPSSYAAGSRVAASPFSVNDACIDHFHSKLFLPVSYTFEAATSMINNLFFITISKM